MLTIKKQSLIDWDVCQDGKKVNAIIKKTPDRGFGYEVQFRSFLTGKFESEGNFFVKFVEAKRFAFEVVTAHYLD